MTIDTVVFDLGGTLIEYAGEFAVWPDLETPGFWAAYHHLNQNGWHLPEFETFKQAGFDLLPVRWQQAAAGEQNLRLVDLIAESLAAAGVQGIPVEYLTQAAELYESAICAQAIAMPDAREVVAQVKAAGFKIGLVSNTMFRGTAHRADMERFGLLDFFDAMVFSADVNKWKPTAAPFLHVLDELGVGGETAVYIGDDPGSDMVGGQRAGMRTIHYRSSDRFAEPADIQPNARIKKLTDLLPILTKWQ